MTTPNDEQPRRRWFQFRLRTLLVLTTVVAVGLGWFLRERRWVAEQQRVLRPHMLRGYHGKPDWRAPVWGYDEVHYAQILWSGSITDEELRYMRGLPLLTKVNIFYDPEFTDEGVAGLCGVETITSLNLEHTGITDAGLEHLGGLSQLEWLGLRDDDLTGRGFAHLAALQRLTFLGVDGEQITDEGLEHLGKLSQVTELRFQSDRCTDAGLKHLHGLKQLKVLAIYSDRFTDEGIAELQRALPNCAVSR